MHIKTNLKQTIKYKKSILNTIFDLLYTAHIICTNQYKASLLINEIAICMARLQKLKSQITQVKTNLKKSGNNLEVA